MKRRELQAIPHDNKKRKLTKIKLLADPQLGPGTILQSHFFA